MQKKARYFIVGNRAYRSEVALFRHERVTADRCAVLKASPGLSSLYLVEGQRGAMTAWSDMQMALKAMLRSNGLGLISIPVF